jgi:hypothetical protein
MNRFTSLWPHPGTPGLHGPSADQAEVVRRFPAAVAASSMHWWSPGDPVAGRGARFLVGVAPYSWYDLRLLDRIDEAFSVWRSQEAPPRVDVFNTAECLTQEDFNRWVPGIAPVFQSPILGIWLDGRFLEAHQGFAARDLVARRFGSSSAEITQEVPKANQAGASSGS